MIKIKPKILCVDDESANLKLLDAMLSPKGYEIVKANNGKEALKKIEEQSVDLILLDVMMPDINGFEVCKKIKENEKFRNIPIIMITVLSSRKDRIQSIESGADDFISKPFDHGEVSARIRMLLKMKDLNDRLNHGYNNITSLTSFGEEILKTYDPLSFNFTSKIDSIVNQVIRQATEISEKPQIVVVGLMDINNNWQWHQYESTFKELYKTQLKPDLLHSLKLPEKGNSKIVFFNKPEFEKSEFQEFIIDLESTSPITYSNFTCYLSEDFCIFAFNYVKDVTVYDATVLRSLVIQSLFLKSLSNQIKKTENAFEYIAHALVRASEANDLDIGNHVLRVGEFCGLIAEKLKMPEHFITTIRLQAQMHDIGMVSIPLEILKNPGELSFDEWGIIRKHPINGARILGDHPKLKMAKNIILTHHEKWDGSGYPSWLKGEKIPVEGRIVSLADHYDSLRNARAYKPAFDHKTTYEIIVEGNERTKPIHFDPEILKVFKESASQFEEIYEKLKG